MTDMLSNAETTESACSVEKEPTNAAQPWPTQADFDSLLAVILRDITDAVHKAIRDKRRRIPIADQSPFVIHRVVPREFLGTAASGKSCYGIRVYGSLGNHVCIAPFIAAIEKWGWYVESVSDDDTPLVVIGATTSNTA